VNGAPGLVRFIGVCEIAGALGLILPAAFKILPRLTAFAATGLLAIMVLAVPFHLFDVIWCGR
jgi:putative oxidoreductase